PAADASQVVLCECSSKSGQSFMDIGRAVELAEAITAARRKTVVIISSHDSLVTDNPRIISGGSINIRQTARLTEYVDLFIGCGSGFAGAGPPGTGEPRVAHI